MRVSLSGFSEDLGQFWNGFKWQSECIDPNRPGWLPRWIPTLEEKACQFGMYQGQGTPTNPPMVTIAAPQTVPQMTDPSLWTPEISAQATRVSYIDEATRTIDEYQRNQSDINSRENTDTGLKIITAAAIVAVVVGVAVAASRR